MNALIRRAGYALVGRSLRRTFRRIAWVGPFAPPPADVPAVLYANHHVFHDSYVLATIVERVLRRRAIIWMEAFDRFPFFGPLGAMPLPANDGGRRLSTIRRTARLMRAQPSSMLIYYPEGQLHDAQRVAPFPDDRMARLAAVLPPRVLWWPVALRVTGFHDFRPTLTLAAGTPHAAITGHEQATLQRLMATLVFPGNAERRVLLEGQAGPHERWNFALPWARA